MRIILILILSFSAYAKDCEIKDIKSDFIKTVGVDNSFSEDITVDPFSVISHEDGKILFMDDACGINNCIQVLYKKIEGCYKRIGTFDGNMKVVKNKGQASDIHMIHRGGTKRIFKFDTQKQKYRVKR